MENTSTIQATATTEESFVPKVSIEEMNKKIARTIFFKDRMIQINDDLKEGKTEQDVEMSVFEIELRAKEGNYKFFKREEDGRYVKLFHWDLIQRSINKIKALRQAKARMLETQSEAVTA